MFMLGDVVLLHVWVVVFLELKCVQETDSVAGSLGLC